MFVDIIKVFIL